MAGCRALCEVAVRGASAVVFLNFPFGLGEGQLPIVLSRLSTQEAGVRGSICCAYGKRESNTVLGLVFGWPPIFLMERVLASLMERMPQTISSAERPKSKEDCLNEAAIAEFDKALRLAPDVADAWTPIKLVAGAVRGRPPGNSYYRS